MLPSDVIIPLAPQVKVVAKGQEKGEVLQHQMNIHLTTRHNGFKGYLPVQASFLPKVRSVVVFPGKLNSRLGQTHQSTLTTQTAVFHQFFDVFFILGLVHFSLRGYFVVSIATKTNQKMLVPLNSLRSNSTAPPTRHT